MARTPAKTAPPAKRKRRWRGKNTNAGGRPSKLTPEIQAKILEFVRAGNYLHIAAVASGIGETTFRRWMEQGEAQPKGRFHTFRRSLLAAEAQAEAETIARVHALGREG